MKQKILLSIVSLSLGLLLSFAASADPASPSERVQFTGGDYKVTEDRIQVPLVQIPERNELEALSCEGVTHYHRNTARFRDTDFQDFSSVIHAFAIVLEDDFIENVDTSDLRCSDGGNLDTGLYTVVDCSFDADNPRPQVVHNDPDNFWNGLKITYQTLDWVEGDPKGLVWEYSTNDPGNLNYLLWNNSFGDFKEEFISFKAKDETRVTTATTRSWIKLQNIFIHEGDDPWVDANWHQNYLLEAGDGSAVDPDGDYVHWWGENGIEETTFLPCVQVCEDLTVSPPSLNTEVIESPFIEFSVEARDTLGDLIEESNYTYRAFDLNGDPSPDGQLRRGPAFTVNRGNELTGEFSEIQYHDQSAGDLITIDFNGDEIGPGACSYELELPFCESLEFTSPADEILVLPSGTQRIDLSINTSSSTGGPWPLSFEYSSTDPDATFNGNPTPFVTTLQSGVVYESSSSSTVSVRAIHDSAGTCIDSFSLILEEEPLFCENLDIISPSSPVPVEIMEAGDVLIEWESTLSDGSNAPGPWEVSSSNPSGVFKRTDGTILSTSGLVTSTSETQLLYTGTPGDSVSIRDITPGNEICQDQITSTPRPDADVCTGINLNPPPYLDDLDRFYSEEVICFDYDLSLSGPEFESRLIGNLFNDESLSARNGSLRIEVNETGSLATGNPARENLSAGFSSYTGQVCVQDFAPNNLLTLEVEGHEGACSADFLFPELDPAVCSELSLSPDSFVIPAGSPDTGILPLTIEVSGERSDFSGTVVLSTSGTCTLSYSDGSPSEFLDGRLEIPVSGRTSSITAFCEGGTEGEVIDAYLRGQAGACSDNLAITATPPGLCESLETDPHAYIIPEDRETSESINLSTTVRGENAGFSGTLIVESEGTCSFRYSDGSPSEFPDGRLEIPVSGLETRVTYTCEGASNGDLITSFVRNQAGLCSDDLLVSKIFGDAPICTDLNISPSILSEDGEMAVTVTGSSEDFEDVLTVLSPEGCELRYSKREGSEFADGRLEFPVSGLETRVEFFCEDIEEGEVEAFIRGQEALCSDTTETEIAPVCEDISFDERRLTAQPGEDGRVTLEVDSELEDQTLVVTYEGCPGDIIYDGDDFDGELEIDFDGDEEFDLRFENLCRDAEIEAYIEGHKDTCSTDLPVNILNLEPGEFSSFIYTFNFSSEKDAYSDQNIFFAHDADRAFYTLEYEPAGKENDIIFEDDMWTGDLGGILGSGGASNGDVILATTYNELTSSSRFTYDTITAFGFGERHEIGSSQMAAHVQNIIRPDSFQSFIPYLKFNDGSQSQPILSCAETSPGSLCFDPNVIPEREGQVRIENVHRTPGNAVIRVRFVGIVLSGLDCSRLTDNCLTEQFEDNARLYYSDAREPLRAQNQLVTLCAYLLTRNGADIYLESPLQGGSDISCIFRDVDESISADYRNVDALVILDGNTQYSSENNYSPLGFDSSFSSSTVSVCDDSEYAENVIGNLSSYVCEVVSSVSDLWRPATVQENTNALIGQATRNTVTNQGDQTEFRSFDELRSSLENLNNPSSGILTFDGSNAEAIHLYDLTIPDGAYTLVVENADLVIHGNIQYAASTNVTNLPSMAFIVNGGNIHIDNTAFRLVGVYYTDQNFTADNRHPVNEPLSIDGSLYGNVQALLDAAQYVGPVSDDGAGLVIRYDNRILLSTPPALSEYVDVSTEEALN